MKAKYSKNQLEQDIIREGKVLGLHPGSTSIIAKLVAESVSTWASSRSEITKDDLTRITAKELTRYNQDLSYVYKNRDKII